MTRIQNVYRIRIWMRNMGNGLKFSLVLICTSHKNRSGLLPYDLEYGLHMLHVPTEFQTCRSNVALGLLESIFVEGSIEPNYHFE